MRLQSPTPFCCIFILYYIIQFPLIFIFLNLILILAPISSSYYLFGIFVFIFARKCYISEAEEAVQVQTIQKHQFTQNRTFSQGL